MSHRIIIPVLVCGSRTFDLGLIMPWVMGPTLLPILDTVQIVQGGAPGADTKAYWFAKGFGLDHREFPALWDQYGKEAGLLRNDQTADYCSGIMKKYNVPGYCFAFWDGQSRGTADMIRRAKAYRLTVHVEKYLPRELYHTGLMMEWEKKIKQRAQQLKLI